MATSDGTNTRKRRRVDALTPDELAQREERKTKKRALIMTNPGMNAWNIACSNMKLFQNLSFRAIPKRGTKEHTLIREEYHRLLDEFWQQSILFVLGNEDITEALGKTFKELKSVDLGRIKKARKSDLTDADLLTKSLMETDGYKKVHACMAKQLSVRRNSFKTKRERRLRKLWKQAILESKADNVLFCFSVIPTSEERSQLKANAYLHAEFQKARNSLKLLVQKQYN